MHISEGVLSIPVLVSGAVVAVAGIAVGLKKMDYDHVASVGILAAAFFVASLIHLPVGPSSVHLILSGLLGAVLGWAAFPAIFAGLLLQCVLFQYGGLTTLGLNTAIMAGPAVLCALALRPMLGEPGLKGQIGAFLCGSLAVLLSGLGAAAALAASGDEFIPSAKLLLLGHVPVMIVEGFVTMAAVSFLSKVRPEVLQTVET